MQIHALEIYFWQYGHQIQSVLGVVWVEFQLMIGGSSECGLCPWICSGIVGAYESVSQKLSSLSHQRKQISVRRSQRSQK